jgi:DNA-binding transcriptional LysR family regulator
MSPKKIANDLIIFAQFSSTPSFIGCAEILGITKASVSRSVAKLEEYYGVALLVRSPRGVKFTNAGTLVSKYALQLLESIEVLGSKLDEFKISTKGHLNVAAPAAVATLKLSPLLHIFSQKNPEIDIELDMVEHTLNPVTDPYDFVLSWFPPQDHNVYAKLLTSYDIVIVSSPMYLAENGIPKHPKELGNFNCLHYKYYSGKKQWKFLIHGELEAFSTGGRFTVATSTLLKEPLKSGQGIARLPKFIVQDELDSGELVQLLENYEIEKAKLYAVYANKGENDPVVTKLLEFVVDKLGGNLNS